MDYKGLQVENEILTDSMAVKEHLLHEANMLIEGSNNRIHRRNIQIADLKGQINEIRAVRNRLLIDINNIKASIPKTCGDLAREFVKEMGRNGHNNEHIKDYLIEFMHAIR